VNHVPKWKVTTRAAFAEYRAIARDIANQAWIALAGMLGSGTKFAMLSAIEPEVIAVC